MKGQREEDDADGGKTGKPLPTPVHETLRRLLLDEGAVAWGVAEAGEVDRKDWEIFEDWLARGYHAGMKYMENYREIRRDPRLLLQGAATVISVAFNYRQPNPREEIATYALGMDYHKVLRRRLKKVISAMKAAYGGEWRICIDSAPILERYWARRCGVGFRSGLHGNIVVPGVGSMVFLAEIVTTLGLEPASGHLYSFEDESGASGGVTENMKICPTGALQPGGTIASGRCLNYLTIENEGEFSQEERLLLEKAGAGVLFGCDRCLRACPFNRDEPKPVIPEFNSHPEIERIAEALRKGDYDAIPTDSPVSRRKKKRPRQDSA